MQVLAGGIEVADQLHCGPCLDEPHVIFLKVVIMAILNCMRDVSCHFSLTCPQLSNLYTNLDTRTWTLVPWSSCHYTNTQTICRARTKQVRHVLTLYWPKLLCSLYSAIKRAKSNLSSSHYSLKLAYRAMFLIPQLACWQCKPAGEWMACTKLILPIMVPERNLFHLIAEKMNTVVLAWCGYLRYLCCRTHLLSGTALVDTVYWCHFCSSYIHTSNNPVLYCVHSGHSSDP